MIFKQDLSEYVGPALVKTKDSLVVSPSIWLRPYIANYTFTNPRSMPEGQMLLASVSTTLVFSVAGDALAGGLRGVNTRAEKIGTYGQQSGFMFLVEFHPAGLYPFVRWNQSLLLNTSYRFEDVAPDLNREIMEGYQRADTIEELVSILDKLFLTRLDSGGDAFLLRHSIQRVVQEKGKMQVKALSQEMFYSEKQLNRLFQRHVGTGVKTFSRIVRMKYAAHCLGTPMGVSQVSEITGHYDPAHFVRDFKSVHGITPAQFKQKMSLFYNDPFKLGGYT